MRSNQGNTLIVVLVLTATLIGIVGSAMQYTQGVARQAQRERANVSAQAIGDGCFDLAFSSWRQICRRDAPVMPTEPYSGYQYTVPYTYIYQRWSPPATSAFANIPLPTAAMFPNVSGFTATRGPNDVALSFTISNYMVQAVDPQFTLTTADPPFSTIPTTQQPPFTSIDGFKTNRAPASWFYLASADITLSTASGRVTTKMRRIFEKRFTRPLGYHFIYFNDDLELHPNSTSPLTLYGKIHTNGTLYTGSSALTLNSVIPHLDGNIWWGIASATGPSKTDGVSYGDDWIIGFKPGDTYNTGGATAPVIAPNTPVERKGKFALCDLDPEVWNSTDTNPNNDDPHELIEKPTTPLSTYPDPLSKNAGIIPVPTTSNYGPVIQNGIKANSTLFTTMRYYTQAGIRIEISNANPPVMTVRNAMNATDLKNGLGEVLSSTVPRGPENTTVTTDPSYYHFAWAHDWLKTAFGVSPGNLLAPPNGLNAGVIRPMRVGTNGATTINNAVVTSAAGATTIGPFVATDIGRLLKGTTAAGVNVIPDGARIISQTATTATMSKQSTATATGVTLTLEGSTSPIGSAAPLVPHIQDPREASPVELITIDWDVFKAWDGGTPGAYGHNPPNYLYGTGVGDYRRLQIQTMLAGAPDLSTVYVSLAPVAGRKRAIRIKNAGRIDRLTPDPSPKPSPYTMHVKNPILTLITDGPLYIQGDLNTGRTNANKTTQPKSNLTAGPRTTVYAQPLTDPYNYESAKPPLLIADSVTVLSNAWDDRNSALGLASRIASNTTINTRIIAGDVPTSATNGYSGGGENFIRLLEDWSGKYFTFTGSLMQLYHSKIATGTWGKANVYVEPKPVAGVGGRCYYEGIVFTMWDTQEPQASAYFKHRWSPTP